AGVFLQYEQRLGDASSQAALRMVRILLVLRLIRSAIRLANLTIEWGAVTALPMQQWRVCIWLLRTCGRDVPDGPPVAFKMKAFQLRAVMRALAALPAIGLSAGILCFSLVYIYAVIGMEVQRVA
ncbi:MAG: hypothetical protein SGPRY_010719, partial [Prymnesium sp.]